MAMTNINIRIDADKKLKAQKIRQNRKSYKEWQ